MNKKDLIIKVVAGILALVAIAVGVFIFTDKKEKELTDAEKFKQEYESLNNTVREGTKNTYSAITIPKENPIKYVPVKETIDLLSSDDAIIYVGANWCPWCRGAIVPLIDVVNNYNIKNLYYLNLDDDKSLFEVQDKKLVETREGTKEYYELLEKLNKYLRDYTITEDKATYDTKEKRIYQPTIITIKDGEIVKVDGTTITLDKDQTAYDKITDEQYKFYYEHFEELVKEIYNNGCEGETESCD